MLLISQNNCEQTKLEKKLHAILEPKEKLSPAQFIKVWESLDDWMESRVAEEGHYAVGALLKAAIDPGSTLHPDVLHDEVSVLLRTLYQLKACCPEIYNRRITEQFLVQVLWADVFSLYREAGTHVDLNRENREKLSLTPKKLELLGRSFQDVSLAWQMANAMQENPLCGNHMNLVSGNTTEVFFARWKELSGRKMEITADDALNQLLIRTFREADEEDMFPSLYGGLGRNPYTATGVITARMKDLISGVDHFVKKEFSPELADLIVRKKDMELTVTALNNNLISSDESEIEAAMEAAGQTGETKVIPMLIRKKWEAV